MGKEKVEHDDHIDRKPDEVKEQKEEPEKPVELHPFRFYWAPANFTKIVQNNKLLYGLWGAFFYIG